MPNDAIASTLARQGMKQPLDIMPNDAIASTLARQGMKQPPYPFTFIYYVMNE